MVNQRLSKKCVRRLIGFLSVISIFLLSFETLLAEVAKGPKRSVQEWRKYWESSQLSNEEDDQMRFISRVGVVRKSEKGFNVLPLDQKDIFEESFLKVPEERQILLTRFVNKPSILGDNYKPSPCEASYQVIASCFGLDAILDVSGKRWVLFGYDKKNNKLNKILDGAEFGEEYIAWINKKLSYDGVIVDTEGDYLLVLLPPGREGSEIQALTRQDSAEKIALPKNKIKGTRTHLINTAS
jgi:hypothetical protein